MNIKQNYNYSKILVCDIKQPLPFFSFQTIPSSLEIDKMALGFILSDQIQENALINNILTLKGFHDKGYTTFVIISLSDNLVQTFGYFNAVKSFCNLVQFNLHKQIVKPILRLFIDTVIDNLDTTTSICFPDNLLCLTGISRSQLPAQCNPIYISK